LNGTAFFDDAEPFAIHQADDHQYTLVASNKLMTG